MIIVFLSITSNSLYAGGECKLSKAYKDARYDAYSKIKKPYDQCKNTMKEAYYWKAVAACKNTNDNKTAGISCGQLVDNGTYPSEAIDISHCNAFKWNPSDITAYLNDRVKSGNLIMCKN